MNTLLTSTSQFVPRGARGPLHTAGLRRVAAIILCATTTAAMMSQAMSSRVRADEVTRPLVEWAFEFNVVRTLHAEWTDGLGGTSTYTTTIDLVNSDGTTHDMGWDSNVTGSESHGCESGGPATSATTGSGSGTGSFDWLGPVDPYRLAEWGQSGDWQDVTPIFATGSPVEWNTTTISCDGSQLVSSTPTSPLSVPLWIPGSLQSLNAEPIGTVLNYSYDEYVGTTDNYRETSVVGTATKVDPTGEVCIAYRDYVQLDAGSLDSRLYEFDSTVFYDLCTAVDGTKRIEIRSVNPYGETDPGVLAGALELLGFTTNYDAIDTRWYPVQNPGGVTVVVTGPKFQICFDFAVLIDKLGLRKTLEKQAVKRLAKLYSRFGVSAPEVWNSALDSEFESIAIDSQKVIVKYAGKLPLPGPATDSLTQEISELVAGFLEDLKENMQSRLVGVTSGSAAEGELAEAIADSLASLTTACFDTWTPWISHTLNYTGGSAADWGSYFNNPFFAMESLAAQEHEQL